MLPAAVHVRLLCVRARALRAQRRLHVLTQLPVLRSSFILNLVLPLDREEPEHTVHLRHYANESHDGQRLQNELQEM